MKISVIIPVYNVEKYLERCIASVIGQTYRALEIFLIDDGSNDRSGEICDEWKQKDDRIIVIHKENAGQGVARNLALDRATGEYIVFVDSDDYIEENMIFGMLSAAKKHNAELVLCGYKVDNGLRIKNVEIRTAETILENLDLMNAYCKGDVFTGPWAKMFHRRLFEEIRFPAFRANEDAYIMHRLLGRSNRAVVLKEHYYIQDVTGNSTERSSFNINKVRLLDCALELRAYIRENYPEYVKLVAEKPAKEAINLLEKIYIDGAETRFLEVERSLRLRLKEEYDYLLANFSKADSLKEIKKVLQKPQYLKRRAKRIKRKRKWKRFLKNVLKKIKRR